MARSAGLCVKHYSTRKRLSCAVLLAMSATLGGCFSSGVELVSVSGKVTLDGSPLPEAFVRFVPIVQTEGESVRPSSGKTDASGNYTLHYSSSQRGIRPGKYQVRITTFVPAEPEVTEGAPEVVPYVYNVETTLEADVSSKQKTYDWDLKSDASPVKKPR